jgi:hypothetical protein
VGAVPAALDHATASVAAVRSVEISGVLSHPLRRHRRAGELAMDGRPEHSLAHHAHRRLGRHPPDVRLRQEPHDCPAVPQQLDEGP